MVSYRYLGSALTNSNGVATFDYQGSGAGEIDVIASLDKPITDGSIVSETLSVLDTLMYDTGTDPSHNIWAGDTTNLTRGNEYSTLREAEEDTTTRIVTQLPKGLWFLNMKARRDGSTGNYNFEVIHNNATIFGWATPNGDTWADLKLVYDGEYISCFINDSSTPARTERVYIDETKNTYFRLQTPQSITYVDFKDLLVFREGASSISIGSSTPIIQSGDTASITGSLYESGLPVQNATLDVYKDGSKVGTASTGSTGVASYSYSGTGVGECEFQFKYGSILSEIFVVTDATFKDIGNTDNSSNWILSAVTYTQTDDYVTLDNSSGASRWIYPKVNGSASIIDTNTDYCWEIDLKNVDATNLRFALDGTAIDNLHGLITTTGFTTVKIYTAKSENKVYYEVNGVTRNVTASTSSGDIYIRLVDGETFQFKNMKVYPI